LSPNGTSRRALIASRTHSTIALSDSVFGEISEVLSRPKFARILTNDRRCELLELLAAAALWVDPTAKVEDCRDAKDNRYLELALTARATAIVSLDEDLLVLDPWRGVRMLRPAEFLEQFAPDERQGHN
jgi:putative PIN family toxin of toxin-antitoxin system